MSDKYAKELLKSGILEIKSKDFDAGRRFIERAIDLTLTHDDMAEAWFWLSEALSDPTEKRAALENCLSYDLHYPRARRSLAILDGRLPEDEVIDPTHSLPSTADGLRESQADRFACPKCGGRMTFSADGQTLICEYCAREDRIRAINGAENEQDFTAAMFSKRGHGKPLQERVFHCEGCGAQFIIPPDQIAVSCAYCDSPHVVNYEKEKDLLAPDSILPFALNQDHATRSLIKWVEENDIHPTQKVNRPRGLYLPAWTFDIGGNADYSGEETVYEYSPAAMRMEKKVISIRDTHPVFENDLTLPASRKIASLFARLLPSFDLSNLKEYDARYLVGWIAEVYDTSLGDASLEARRQAFSNVKKQIIKYRINATIERVSSSGMFVESFKLILLPIWKTEIASDEGKKLVLINGQNGKVASDIEIRSQQNPSLWDWLGL